MSHYLFLFDVGGPRWVIMGIVVKLAQGVSPPHLVPCLMFDPDLNRSDYVSDLMRL
jgi:hypothetical protein